MKKIMITVFAVIGTMAAFPSFSQTEKGNFLIGGTASIGHSNALSTSSTSFGLAPSVSYFFVDRFAAGLTTSLGLNSSKSDDNSSKSNFTSFGLGPTVRYYFPVSEGWAVFPTVDYQFTTTHSKTENLGITTTNNSNSNLFRAGAGLTYFMAKNVGVEGILYYQNISQASVSQSSIALRVGFQIYINRNN